MLAIHIEGPERW